MPGHADLAQVTYCGLYCGLCSQRGRVPPQARALRDTMRRDGWEHWGQEIENFSAFWKFLNGLGESEARCSCRVGECGPPFCGIRKCAREKKVEVCPDCAEYPCQRIQSLAKGYVNLLADGERMKAIGLAAWIAEQEERRKTGFVYADIRCYPYEVPAE